MEKISITSAEDGIKIIVNDEKASVEDLLTVWQPLCDDEIIYKQYADGNHKACRGCKVNCCKTAFLIPDLVAFKKISCRSDLTYQECVKRYFDEDELNRGLVRLKSNPCVFLNDDLCSFYDQRALMCRFYICANSLGDAEQLLYSIAWIGSTATQIFAEKNGLLPERSSQGSGSFERLFYGLISDYRSDPRVDLFMKADNYGNIPLKPFLERH
ncbi:MAG: YkgJ family cysteine cluster protein [Syntrophomonadaceae bacterium]|jgi:Fe-S-cluster containining protein|nr:YkgJ family cysteine cluster protein [Syntrophomonadaceae bacterium]